MAEQDPNENPDSSAGLVGAPVPPPPPAGQGTKQRRITHEEWERMYQAWKAGQRNQTELARQFRVSADTINKYVHKGLAVNAWPPWTARLHMEQATHEEMRRRATEQAIAQALDEYGEVRRDNLKVLKAVAAVCSVQVGKAIENLKNVAWTRTAIRYWHDADTGAAKRESYERPLDAAETAAVIRAIATALAMTGKMQSFWLGGPTERIEDIPAEEKFTPQDADYILEHDGELPPGMTIERLIGKMNRTFGITPPKPAN